MKKIKRDFRVIIIVIIIFIALSTLGMANEGVFQPCSGEPLKMFYVSEIDKIIIGCKGQPQEYRMLVLDTMTLNQIKNYPVNGHLMGVDYLDSEDRIIALVNDSHQDLDPAEGRLLKINYLTDQIIDELPFSLPPERMVIDDTGTNLFLSLGFSSRRTGKIQQIAVSNFQVLNEIDFGRTTPDLAISPDGSKLYAPSGWGHAVHGEELSHVYDIGVFSTTNLATIENIVTPSYPGDVEILPNSTYLYMESDSGIDILDMQTDEIINQLTFYYFGKKVSVSRITISEEANKMFCITYIPEFVPEINKEIPVATNVILQVDLSDFSYEFFELGDETFWRIESVPNPNPLYDCRLFCTTKDSSNIHYIDIEAD